MRNYRTLLSAGLILALVFVLTGAACLACSDLLTKKTQTSHGCCKKAQHCPNPQKAPSHKQCAAAPVTPSLALSGDSVKAFTDVAVHSDETASVVLVSQTHGVFHTAYTPPDRCVLNSILII